MNLRKSHFFYLLVSITLFLSSCKKEEVTNITIDKPTLAILVGQTDTLFSTITCTGEIDKFPIKWETSNSSIISVNQNGVIYGVAAGTVNITARAGDKFVTSTVTASSEINPIFDKGFLVYFGDTLHTTVSNLFLLEIRNTNEAIDIFLNVDALTTDSLPSGKYSVLTSIRYKQDLLPHTIIPGLIEGYTTYYGSPKSMFGYSERPIEDGNITVTRLTNEKYKVNYVFFDVTRTIIFGAYTGPLEYHNFKKASGKNKTALQQKLNGLKTTASGFKIPLY